MKTVKLFEQFINESKDSQFSYAVLSALESTILEMAENIKKRIIEDYAKKNIKYEFSVWEAEMLRLSLISDMLKSFEKYTEPTDKLIKIQATGGSKGIEITATIERDGVEYSYYTEAISAGGYNIQSFHYRYLTKTKLPNAKVKGTLANEYTERIKKMTKAEKLNNEIKSLETRIENNNQRIQASLALTDEEILADYYENGNGVGKPYKWPDWQQIIKNGAADNYDNDEAYYYQEKAKAEASSVEFWKRRNIGWPQENNKTLEKEILKTRKKLEAVVNQ